MKELKYASLIDSHKFKINCPEEECKEGEILAYRWCNHPITDEINFLPNYIEDEVKGRPPRMLSEEDKKCSACAISFFDDKDFAIKKFLSFPRSIRLKLGYTHVAEGNIVQTDGVISPIKGNHFVLYEYNGVLIKDRFLAVDELNVV